jgi:hypothetical protein
MVPVKSSKAATVDGVGGTSSLWVRMSKLQKSLIESEMQGSNLIGWLE